MSSTAATSNSSSSTNAPSAFSPSTRTIWTEAGAIDIPSTISKPTPPKGVQPGDALAEEEIIDELIISHRTCASTPENLCRTYEVFIGPRRRRAALPLVLRSDARTAVGVLGRAGQPQDA